MHRSRLPWILGFALVILTMAVFWPVLESGFVTWDDDINIYENDLIRGLDPTRVSRMFLDVGLAMRYKPLSWLAWAMIHAWNGLNPFGYHLANLLLHCGNAVLVYQLLRRLLRTGDGRATDDASHPALLVSAAVGAAVWAVHPLRVEPVAWATGLPYNLSLFFMLLSLGSYLRMNEPGRPDSYSRRDYAVSIASYTAALLAYPVAIGYGLVLVVLDWYPLKRLAAVNGRWNHPGTWRVLLEKAPFLGIAGLFTAIALYGRVHPTGIWEDAASIETFGPAARLMQAFYVWGYYLWKPWLPMDLSPIYTTLVQFEPTDAPFVLSAIMVIAMTILAWWRRSRWPAFTSLWLCHLILLVPVLGLTEHPHFPSDRYGLAVGVLWCVPIAGGIYAAWGMKMVRTIVIVAGVAAMLVLSGLSLAQVRVWHDDIAFFRHLIATTGPGNYGDISRHRLAVALDSRGRPAEALAELRVLLAKNPRHPDLLCNAAHALFSLNRLEEAQVYYAAASQVRPADPLPRVGLGVVLAAAGDLDGARRSLEDALRIDPRLASAHYNLGLILTKQGRPDEARIHFDQAGSKSSSNPPPSDRQ